MKVFLLVGKEIDTDRRPTEGECTLIVVSRRTTSDISLIVSTRRRRRLSVDG